MGKTQNQHNPRKTVQNFHQTKNLDIEGIQKLSDAMGAINHYKNFWKSTTSDSNPTQLLRVEKMFILWNRLQFCQAY